jgi:hypothetical protein
MLWSRPMPLGWYFAEQWRRFFGNNWVEQLCDKFIIQDRFLKNFANELPVVRIWGSKKSRPPRKTARNRRLRVFPAYKNNLPHG